MSKPRTFEEAIPTNPRFHHKKLEWNDEDLGLRTAACFSKDGSCWLVQECLEEPMTIFLSRSSIAVLVKEQP